MDILMDFQDVMSRVESPSLFRVQFVCNLGGNYRHSGRYGRFFLLFVDCMYDVDAQRRHGQSHRLIVDQDVAGLPLWGKP